jgi:hypothetical protein
MSSGEKEQVNHPTHYAHPSGVEAIDICEHMSFNLGNALKYVFRAGLKSDDKLTDLRKALWYIERQERLAKVMGPYGMPEASYLTVRLLSTKVAEHPSAPLLKKFVDVLKGTDWDCKSLMEALRTEIKLVSKGDR